MCFLIRRAWQGRCVRHPRAAALCSEATMGKRDRNMPNERVRNQHGARRAPAHMHAHARAHAGALTARPQWVRAPGAQVFERHPMRVGANDPRVPTFYVRPRWESAVRGMAVRASAPCLRPAGWSRVRPHRHNESHVPMRAYPLSGNGSRVHNPHWVRDHHPGYERRCSCMLVRIVPFGMMPLCPLA